MRTSIFIFTFLILSFALRAQHSLLYEVTGNGLKKPSYLFGTFHFLTKSFVDSQTVVMQKLKTSKIVVGEIITDSMTLSPQLMAAMMADTPLNKLLDSATYQTANTWMRGLSGMDLTFYTAFKPMAVNAVMMQLAYQKYFHPPSEPLMDIYVQSYARKRKKKVRALESLNDQIGILFTGIPLKRQAEHFKEFINEKDSVEDMMQTMLTLYRHADYDSLLTYMYSEDFTDEEINTMLPDRNNAWMQKLPAMMKEQPTFVAVGALHLAGENGLVALLRKQGYNVTPLPLR